MMELLQALTCIFGALSLLALVTSGFTMMFSPATGRQMLKNTFTAIGMCVIASMLLQAACGALAPRRRAALSNWGSRR
jgi:hypothetical protein